MSIAWVVAGIFVPWTAGAAILRCISARRTDGTTRRSDAPVAGHGGDNGLLHLGAGWLLGQMLLMTLMYASLVFFGAPHARAVLLLMVFIAAAAGLVALVRGRRRANRHTAADGDTSSTPQSHSTERNTSRTGTALVVIFGVLVAASMLVKLYVLVQAHAYVPVRNDDAIRIWLYNASHIVVHEALPSADPDDVYLGGSNHRLPVFAIPAWLPLLSGPHNDSALGNERLATLPWIGFYVCLPLCLAGGLRRWLAWRACIAAAYLVASLPLLVIHAYRPGYVDMFLAAYLAGSVIYLLTWRTTGSVRHLIIGMLFAVGAASMKREGAAVAGTATAALLLSSWRQCRALPAFLRWSLGVAFFTAVLILASRLHLTDIAEHSAEYRHNAEVWPALARNAFEWTSFHFAGWLVAAAVIYLLVTRRGEHVAAALAMTLGLIALDVAVLVFTPLYRFALNDQTTARLWLQILPAIIAALAVPLGTATRKPL